MTALTENDVFLVQHEYESVFAVRKSDGRRLDLGEHYGDPEGATILGSHPTFVVWGEGLTVRHGEGPILSFFRSGVPPEPRILAAALPSDPDYPGNPFKNELYPVDIESVHETGRGLVAVQARPPMRLLSRWLLHIGNNGKTGVSPEVDNPTRTS
jgi:hypothetical protein